MLVGVNRIQQITKLIQNNNVVQCLNWVVIVWKFVWVKVSVFLCVKEMIVNQKHMTWFYLAKFANYLTIGWVDS